MMVHFTHLAVLLLVALGSLAESQRKLIHPSLTGEAAPTLKVLYW